MMMLILILAAISVCVVVHVMSMAAAGWLVGVPLERIKLFFGPRIKQINLGNVALDLHSIPIGGYVKFSDDFQKVHPIKRILIAICGCLALLILAIIVFGAFEAFHKFVRGFSQIISGAIAPRSAGASLLVALYEFARANPFTTVLGLVASKMAAGNLLPFPALNGGDIVLMLINWIKPMSPTVRERLQRFGLVLSLIIFICWLVAFYFFLRRVLI